MPERCFPVACWEGNRQLNVSVDKRQCFRKLQRTSVCIWTGRWTSNNPCGGHHDSDRTAVLVWSPRLKLLYCKYHQFMYTLPNKDFLPSFLPSMKKLRLRLHILGVINACLTGTTCAMTLRNSTQALVLSAAWIRVTVWSRTPNVKVDVNINTVILTISGCLMQTHVFQLLVLTGIALMGIRGKRPVSFWQWKQRNTTASPAWHNDYEAHPNSSPFRRHKKWSVSSLRTGPQMVGWQRPARRSGRLSDSRVYQTYGAKEIRKEGRSSQAARADSRAQILMEAGLFEGGPETGAWLQDTELINDDTRKKILSGVVQSCI